MKRLRGLRKLLVILEFTTEVDEPFWDEFYPNSKYQIEFSDDVPLALQRRPELHLEAGRKKYFGLSYMMVVPKKKLKYMWGWRPEQSEIVQRQSIL